MKFTNILDANKLVCRSMSRKGNCWDNAVAESFFKTIKVESVYNENYHDQNQAKLSLLNGLKPGIIGKEDIQLWGIKQLNT